MQCQETRLQRRIFDSQSGNYLFGSCIKYLLASQGIKTQSMMIKAWHDLQSIKKQKPQALTSILILCKFQTNEPVKLLSCVQLFVIPRTVAYQASLSMEFSRQEYWSRLPFPSQGDLPNPGIEPRSPALQADTLLSELPKIYNSYTYIYIYTLSRTHTQEIFLHLQEQE